MRRTHLFTVAACAEFAFRTNH